VEYQHLHRIADSLLTSVGLVNNLARFYGELGLSEAAYMEMRERNRNNYEFLKAILAEWVSQRAAEATWNSLFQVLEACRLNDCSHIIETIFKSQICVTP